MTVKQFRRWLQTEIAALDGAEEAETAVYTFRQAERLAVAAGLPQVATIAQSVRVSPLAPRSAQVVMAEMLAALPQEKSDTLTPPQVAKRLGVNPDKVLSWIRSGELSAVNVTIKPGGRPKYRIASADLESFKNRRTPQQRMKQRPRRAVRKSSGKVYF